MSVATLVKPKTVLTHPSKMPWYSFALPQGITCLAPCALRDKSCYARPQRSRYQFIWDKLMYNYELSKDPARFEAEMICALTEAYYRDLKRGFHDFYFRIHDSGDFHSPGYVDSWIAIVKIVNRFKPEPIRFYAPTKSWQIPEILERLVELNALPDVTVRPSSPGFDMPAPEIPGLAAGARMHSKGKPLMGAEECPAYKTGNKCADCRACWDLPEVSRSYHRH